MGVTSRSWPPARLRSAARTCASLKLDEIDEIEPEIREAAMGMAMEKHGCTASVLMTSTWHRVAGPMAELMERGRAGAFPVDTFCMFEVLESCPDERSGPNLREMSRMPVGALVPLGPRSDPAGPPEGQAIAAATTRSTA